MTVDEQHAHDFPPDRQSTRLGTDLTSHPSAPPSSTPECGTIIAISAGSCHPERGCGWSEQRHGQRAAKHGTRVRADFVGGLNVRLRMPLTLPSVRDRALRGSSRMPTHRNGRGRRPCLPSCTTSVVGSSGHAAPFPAADQLQPGFHRPDGAQTGPVAMLDGRSSRGIQAPRGFVVVVMR